MTTFLLASDSATESFFGLTGQASPNSVDSYSVASGTRSPTWIMGRSLSVVGTLRGFGQRAQYHRARQLVGARLARQVERRHARQRRLVQEVQARALRHAVLRRREAPPRRMRRQVMV